MTCAPLSAANRIPRDRRGAERVGRAERLVPVGEERLDRHDRHVEREPRHAEIVVGRLRNRPRHVRAVPVEVHRLVVVPHEVVAGLEGRAREVRRPGGRPLVQVGHAGVDHRDHDRVPAPLVDVPRLGQIELLQVPLVLPERVVRRVEREDARVGLRVDHTGPARHPGGGLDRVGIGRDLDVGEIRVVRHDDPPAADLLRQGAHRGLAGLGRELHDDVAGDVEGGGRAGHGAAPRGAGAEDRRFLGRAPLAGEQGLLRVSRGGGRRGRLGRARGTALRRTAEAGLRVGRVGSGGRGERDDGHGGGAGEVSPQGGRGHQELRLMAMGRSARGSPDRAAWQASRA